MTVAISNERPVIEPLVELIYDRDCPNVAGCREALHAAFAEMQMASPWSEWDRDAPDTPPALRHYGSPTILVNGCDIADAPEDAIPSGNSCRVYADSESGRLSGVPPVRSIVSALRAARRQTIDDVQ